MTKEKKIRIIDIKIDQLSSRGNGLGTYSHPAGMQWTVEVPFSFPGDTVRVQLMQKRRGLFQGKLEEILEPSTDRITPKCIHFAKCGGCRWQHISYEKQLQVKESFVKNCFKFLLTPKAKIESKPEIHFEGMLEHRPEGQLERHSEVNQEVTFYPIIACENPWEYRNKMEFSFSSNKEGEKFLGLMIDSSRGKVLNLTECHLVHGWFITALLTVKKWWDHSSLEAYRPYKDTGSLRTLILREGFRSGERLVMLTVSGNPDYAIHQHQLKSFVAALKEAITPENNPNKLSIFLRIQQIKKGKPTEFYEMHLEGPDVIQEKLYIQRTKTSSSENLKFNISPSAFFQPNTQQAEKIYSLVLQLAKISTDAVVYDLYCGTGTLGICIASHVKEVIGVELSRESAHDAKANVKLNGISNMHIITGAVGEVLNKIQIEQEIPLPDVVVVDPPRSGLEAQAIELLLKLNPKIIVYVSCNPVTQAKNIEELVLGGYTLDCLQPVDQFPQTVHVENIAVLKSSFERIVR